MKKLFLLVASLAASCSLVSAQTNDFGTWTSIQMVKGWDRIYSMARVEHRSYQNVGATECWFAMAGAGYRMTDSLKGDLSYEYWQIPAAGDATTSKVVACLTGTLRRDALAVSLREKWEETFPRGGAAYGVLRSRLRAQYTSGRFTPYLMYEHFEIFNGSAAWQRSLHYAGTEIKLADHHSLDLFYMYHLFPSAAGLASCHLLGVGYVLSL